MSLVFLLVITNFSSNTDMVHDYYAKCQSCIRKLIAISPFPNSTNIFPRSLHLFAVRLGTIDQDEAEKEWVLRPYMNTARKKQSL